MGHQSHRRRWLSIPSSSWGGHEAPADSWLMDRFSWSDLHVIWLFFSQVTRVAQGMAVLAGWSTTLPETEIFLIAVGVMVSKFCTDIHGPFVSMFPKGWTLMTLFISWLFSSTTSRSTVCSKSCPQWSSLYLIWFLLFILICGWLFSEFCLILVHH